MSAKQIVEQVTKEYLEIFNSTGNVDDLLQYYTIDARYMAPGVSAVGRDNFKALFENYVKNKGIAAKSKMEMTYEEIHEAGKFIISTGDYKLTSDGKIADAGKFIGVFKQEDGKWKLHYDMMCSN